MDRWIAFRDKGRFLGRKAALADKRRRGSPPERQLVTLEIDATMRTRRLRAGLAIGRDGRP
jgi:glycine cleavage system aminomethyltransferase T